MNSQNSQLCQSCMGKCGYKRKDSGSHTAVLAQCKECGKVKPILASRHFVKKD